MPTNQPVWKLLAQLGDAHPLDYGGYWVFTDETEVYPAEAEMLIVPDEEDGTYYAYRFALERCTDRDGVLSDNPYHPDLSAWFAKPESERADRPQDSTYLDNVARFVGMPESELRALFCSADALERAQAYRAIGDYHGFDNLDSYPLVMSRAEVVARYSEPRFNV